QSLPVNFDLAGRSASFNERVRVPLPKHVTAVKGEQVQLYAVLSPTTRTPLPQTTASPASTADALATPQVLTTDPEMGTMLPQPKPTTQSTLDESELPARREGF
ncbi:MAG: hypothetical protein JWN98_934, partial [Abditibacteriota bacterium]|nr:hypothetical protein [Abditibacteriota bacterium]